MSRFEYDVCIPVRNMDSTIEATIRSILRQEIPPKRLIVADDGSTDNSADVAKALGVEVMALPAQGLTTTQNTALQVLKSPFCAFVDANDLWAADMSTRQARLWESMPETAAALGTGVTSLTGDPPRRIRQPRRRLIEVTRQSLWRRNVVVKSSTVFRREALLKVGGYRSLPRVEDYDLLFRLLFDGFRLFRTTERLVLCRIRNDGRSATVDTTVAWG